MNHSFHIADSVVGGMLMVSSAFALVFTWNRREVVRGVSYKQFVGSCAVGIMGGALIAVWRLIFGP
jgi:hypothetical protein